MSGLYSHHYMLAVWGQTLTMSEYFLYIDMTCCRFDTKWRFRTNNFSWNHNDTLGVVMVCLLIATLVPLRKLSFGSVFGGRRILQLLIGLLSIGCIIYNDPVRVLYPFSAVITLTTRTPEFLDKNLYFPNGLLFENKFPAIRAELDHFLSITSNGDLVGKTRDTYNGTNREIGSGGSGSNSWRLFQIKVLGSVLPGAVEYFPTVVRLLRRCPDVISCVVSILQPHVMIPSHVGYMKGVVRYMLPLIVPADRESCYLCVNKKKYSWTEGEGVVWDDTYPHMVRNNTNQIRVVLYFDIRRKFMSSLNGVMCDIAQSIIRNSPVVKTQMSAQEKQMQNFGSANNIR